MAESNINPLVSIVLPTYNRAQILPRAIKSILGQTYQNFELIVVDDCSTDNTVEVMGQFKDPRIIYVQLSRKAGAARSRNEGIQRSQGEFIAFEDSDDEWVPDKLEKQMDVFKNAPKTTGVVYSAVWRIWGKRKEYFPPLAKIEKRGVNLHDLLLAGNFITIQAVVRQECFKKVGLFDEKLPRFQDWDLWLRISRHYNFEFIDEPLAIINELPDAISRDKNKFIVALEYLIQKYAGELEKRKKLLARYYYVLGRVLCNEGQFLKGREYLVRACQKFPFNLKYYLFVFISFCGEKTYKTFVKWTRFQNMRASN